MKLTIEDKKKFLAEHFKYEVDMAFYLGIVLIKNLYSDENVNSALLESSLFHIRNLIEFFYFEKSSKYKLDDSRATDFFDEDCKWEDIKPYIKVVIDFVVNRTGKEMAHLTYKRLEGNKETKTWRPVVYLKPMREIVLLFWDKLPSKYFAAPLNETLALLKSIKYN